MTDEQQAVEAEVVEDDRARTLEEVGIRPGSAIIGINQSIFSLSTPAAIEKAKALIAQRHDLYLTLRRTALQQTVTNDWIAHSTEGGSQAYLMESGCQRIIRFFPLELEGYPQPIVNTFFITDPAGNKREAYTYTYRGRGRCPTFSPYWRFEVGSAWSEDGFFTWGGKRIPNPGDVEKKALANWHGNLVRAIFGVERPEWEELVAAGIDVDRIRSKSVDVSGSGKGTSDRRAAQASRDAWVGPALAVTLNPKGPQFQEQLATIKKAGGRWNPDGSKRWFLVPNEQNETLLANLGLVSATEPISGPGETGGGDAE